MSQFYDTARVGESPGTLRVSGTLDAVVVRVGALALRVVAAASQIGVVAPC